MKRIPIWVGTLLGLGLATGSALPVAAREPAPDEQTPVLDPVEEDYPRKRFYWSASLGVDYSTGDYGQSEDTDILFVPVTLKLEYEPVTFSFSVPYLQITGPGSVVGGGDVGVVPPPGTGTGVTTERGVGDVVMGLSYTYYPQVSYLPLVELTGKVKAPTADETRGLGTGEWDAALQLDVTKAFGRISPVVTVGYRFLGDPPGIDLDNVWFTSVGGTFRVADWASAGLLWDWRQSAVQGTVDSHELFPYVSLRVGKHLRVQPYAVFGLTTSAPDYGAGLQVGIHY